MDDGWVVVNREKEMITFLEVHTHSIHTWDTLPILFYFFSAVWV
jgi:hypothetical protein